jgi:transcriptional regulator with XRE-family HTH domain
VAKLARFLGQLRQQRGLADTVVAERSGISLDRLRAAEFGDGPLRTIELRRLANVLGVPDILLLAEMALLRKLRPYDAPQKANESGQLAR